MSKFYTGVGARKASQAVCQLCAAIGERLALQGYTLRSGHAQGCDMAFEAGCDRMSGNKVIYLPWRGFNDARTEFISIPDWAMRMAQDSHPSWNLLTNPVKRLMARNTCQVLGHERPFKKSEFLICWTPDGVNDHRRRTEKTGGTGQAISIAWRNGVDVYNLNDSNDLEMVMEMVGMKQSE